MARLLRIHDRGDDVQHVQELLNYHHIDIASESARLVADGIFGPRTDARVRSFQAHNGLVGDGIVGPLTAARLATLCGFEATYTVQRGDPQVAEAVTMHVSDPPSDGSKESAFVELKSGIKTLINPWKPPPAKLAYTLDFQATWILKNPGAPGQISLGVGSEIGRLLPTPTGDGKYTYWGAGRIVTRVEEARKIGAFKLDAALQASFELKHGVQSDHVLSWAARASIVSGISFAVVKDSFYLFAQGDLGVTISGDPGNVETSIQWIGKGGLKIVF